jgi:hypothetical protein
MLPIIIGRVAVAIKPRLLRFLREQLVDLGEAS